MALLQTKRGRPAKLLNKGDRFGSLVVIEKDSKLYKDGPHYFCRCDCGNKYLTTGSALRSKRTIRCTKCKSVYTAKRNFKHGNAKRYKNSRTYISWACMLTRATNPNIKNAKDYSLRGIIVCERWKDFKNFLEDMGERPENTSIDRINNDSNYEPTNCKWSTRSEQNKNKRRYR